MTALVDSSAWVDFIRATETFVHHQVVRLLRVDEAATTDAVMFEVVGGGRSTFEAGQLLGLLDRCDYLAQMPREDVLAAVDLYRYCRGAGETVRSLNDCLIAAVAIRNDVPVLHRDKDFDVIARHTTLRVVQP